ncbi:MAG TPA: NTP transferase domain-containing protein [Gemmatimonadaceae bacterium]|nr:NTP transferase domain-containing protein [Gemmatimonadaceae bacterium]
MSHPYSAVLVEHFRRPRNQGAVPAASISQEGSNPLCGDRVRIELRLEDGRVAQAGFTANACALCVAAASVLTELVTRAPLDEVETLTVDDLLRALQAHVGASRLNCVRLPLTVMHAGVSLYRQTNHLPHAERARPVAALVLAAGQARRFGAQKLLAPLGPSTVVRAVVETVRETGVEYVIVVIGDGHGGDALRAALDGVSVTWAVNVNPTQGMSSSIVAGLGVVPPDVGALLVVLGDQPTVNPQVIERLIAEWRDGRGPIVAPRYHGLRGNPVLFDRSLFDTLRTLEGDRGARDLIGSDPALVTHVDVAEPAPVDVDTPADYDELLRQRSRMRL